MKYLLQFFCLFLFASSFSVAQSRYEFRGAWVATVDNIDWPSRGNYYPDSQRAEFIRLMDTLQAVGINAVICQVRPAADAFYPSAYEPWSEWLTGKQGKAPNPLYDPLQFMIEEAHKRGMEFHAWCNPYRAVFSVKSSTIAPTHVTKAHPDWFLTYGNTRYFDPGNKQVQRYVADVMKDIVTRYDVDAIHLDDYFYPYRIPGKVFPDAESYRQSGTTLSLDDWRRSNVDSAILMLSHAIKEGSAGKKKVRFGISPFGVWRNSDKDSMGSNTKAGVTNYDDLYADILLWLRNDWIDYVAPQLYWEFGHRVVPFDLLTDWWSKHTYGKDCYIGLGIYKAHSNPAWRDANQIPMMIRKIRNTPNLKGEIYFSSRTFFGNPLGWNDSLRVYYKEPFLLPGDSTVADSLDLRVHSTASAKPVYTLLVPKLSKGERSGRRHTELQIDDANPPGIVKFYKLYSLPDDASAAPDRRGQYVFKTMPVTSASMHLTIPAFGKTFKLLGVIAVDATGRESSMVYLSGD